MTMKSDAVAECIEECGNCADTCLDTLSYCLEQGGEHAEATHVRLMLDCAQICRTSADLMLRGSIFSEDLCAICADVCEECRADCARFTDDAQMQACAEVCARCVSACQAMLQESEEEAEAA